MKHLKRTLVGAAAVVLLVLIGANTALAQTSGCTVSSGNTSGVALTGVPAGVFVIRAESRTDLISAITISCNTASTPIAAGSAVVTVTLNGANFATGQGATTNVTGAIASTTTTCVSATAPDNLSKFACPTFNVATGVALSSSAVAGSVSGSTATFTFTTPSITSITENFVIFGLRADAGGAGVASGSILTATVSLGGTLTATSAAPIQVAIVKTALKTSNFASGFSAFGGQIGAVPAMNMLSCVVAIPTPSGTPATVANGPDPSTVGANSLQLTFQEGFAGAFRAAQANGGTEDTTGTGVIAGGGAVTTAVNGTRLIAVLTGVPAGINVYAPRTLPGKNSTRSGLINFGGGGPLVITRVLGADTDGSGGAPGSIVQDQFDLIPAVPTPSGTVTGTVTIVYEVTTENIASADLIQLNFAITGAVPVTPGTISGAFGLAPAGTPTKNPARPQFIGVGSFSILVKIASCTTYLLYPFAANTNDGNYDTGMAIANTGADTLGTVGVAGSVILNFFPADGSAPFSQTINSNLHPGQTATFVVSSLGKAFNGYVIAVCNFPYAHGIAFIDNPIGGQSGFAQSYAAVVLQVNPVTSTRNFPDLGGL